MKRIILIAAILIVCVAISYTMIKQAKQKPLPIINPIDLKKEMVDPELLRIGQGHAIGDFSFLNQDGQVVTEKEIENKVFVAEYFFLYLQKYLPYYESANATSTKQIQ